MVKKIGALDGGLRKNASPKIRSRRTGGDMSKGDTRQEELAGLASDTGLTEDDYVDAMDTACSQCDDGGVHY